MLQNPCKTLGFKKNIVYKIPPGGGGKPYPASGLYHEETNLWNDKLHIYLIFDLSTDKPNKIGVAFP